MESQGWASEHYEQLVRATGSVTLDTGSVPFAGYGWRDHSRGPRHTTTLDGWGGHVILGCVYPDSGRAWGLSRYYAGDGLITLEGGYVFADGKFEHARVVTAPRLRALRYDGEVLPVALAWSGGLLELRMECDRTLWTSMQRGLAVGKDLEGPGLMYVLNHGRCAWDGDTGYFYSERSDRLNATRARAAPRIGFMTVWEPHLKEQSQALDRIRAGLQGWMRRRLEDPGVVDRQPGPTGGTGVANETVMFDVRGHGCRGRLDRRLCRAARDAGSALPRIRPLAALPDVRDHDGVSLGADPRRARLRSGCRRRRCAVLRDGDGSTVPSPPTAVVGQRRLHRRRRAGAAARALGAHRAHDGRAAPPPTRIPSPFCVRERRDSGVGDCLDYWIRSLRWARPEEPIPLAQECEEWLLANQPDVSALSWGDSRLPNVIYRDYTPVALLDWDLVSLAGPQADLAWWILLDPPESRRLEGIGTHDELVDLWEDATGERATDLRWYLVFCAYRLAAVFAKLFSMMVAQGHMPADAARAAARGRPARAADVGTPRSRAAAGRRPARPRREPRPVKNP